MQDNYYKRVTEKAFKDIKQNCIKIWQSYNDEFGYSTDKINRVKDVNNIKDNGLHLIAMFDVLNIQKLLSMLKPETVEELEEIEKLDKAMEKLFNSNPNIADLIRKAEKITDDIPQF